MLPSERSSPLRPGGWRGVMTILPAIAIALLPKCPACLPAYALVASALGLGFLVDTTYLLPLTVVSLVLAVVGLAWRRNRHSYAPLALGVVGASVVLIGKFVLDTSLLTFAGLALLVAGALWGAWPRGVIPRGACPACDAVGAVSDTVGHEGSARRQSDMSVSTAK